MKNFKIIISSVCVAFLLTYCHNDDKKNVIPTLKVTEDLIIHNVKYSDIITDYNFIPLETTKESLIGNIEKIIFHNNQFFILDQFKARAIFVFSSTGKFMWKLSKFGKGPGEFIEPTDFCIDPVTNNLVVLDLKQLKYYNDKNGSFLKANRLPTFGYKFDFPDESHISYVNGEKGDNLIITDRKGKKGNSYFKYIKETRVVLNCPFIRNGASELLYFANLDYTIYKIAEGNLIPYLKIDFIKNMYSPEDLNLLREDKSNGENFYNIRFYFEGTNKIFLSYYFKKILYYSVFDKNTKKGSTFNYKEIENDVTFTGTLPIIKTYNSDDKIISLLEPSELKKGIGKKNISDTKLRDIADSSELTDNPILFLFKFK